MDFNVLMNQFAIGFQCANVLMNQFANGSMG